jgi:hypothetical protein
MSVSRLSEIDPNPATEPMEVPGKTNEARLDSVIESAMSKIPSATDDETPRPKADLDTLLSENLAKHEAARAEEDSFKASREARDELHSRYGNQGDLSQTLDQYIAWAKAFKENPQDAGQRFAESYLRASPYAIKAHKPAPKAEPYIDGTGKRYNGKVLDEIVDNAMQAGEEKKDFTASAAQREALKEIFPGKTFDEALKTIVRIDRDAFRDPQATAATLAAAFGLPVTPRQQEQAQRIAHLGNQIDAALPTMPGLDQQQVLDILARPDFVRTGDHIADLRRAYAVTQTLARQDQQLGAWADAELAKMPPELAQAVQETILSDKRFAQFIAKNNEGRFGDPNAIMENFRAAVAWVQSNQRAVSKAQRARPVRSSSGALATQLGKGTTLDSAIANALRDY